MKRILSMLVFLIMMMASMSMTFAATEDWAKSGYDFKQVKTVLLYDIDTSGIEDMSRVTVANIHDKFLRESEKCKLNMMSYDQVENKISLELFKDMNALAVSDPVQHDELFKQEIGGVVQLYVISTLDTYRKYYNHHDEYTTLETKTDYRTWYDREGRAHTDSYSYTVPVYHPAYDAEAYDVKMHYEVYDAATHELVFEREDSRSRETDDPKGMLNRSFESFFKELKKKVGK